MSKVKATPHAVYNINYHPVWVPKYRRSVLQKDVEERLKEIFFEIAEQYEFEIQELSIRKGHVHLFVSAPPKYSPAKLVDILKSISSRKTMEEFPQAEKIPLVGEALGKGILCWHLRR